MKNEAQRASKSEARGTSKRKRRRPRKGGTGDLEKEAQKTSKRRHRGPRKGGTEDLEKRGTEDLEKGGASITSKEAYLEEGAAVRRKFQKIHFFY